MMTMMNSMTYFYFDKQSNKRVKTNKCFCFYYVLLSYIFIMYFFHFWYGSNLIFSASAIQLDPFSYTCDQYSRCVRGPPVKAGSSAMSLTECKFTCLKNALLWPAPRQLKTGDGLASFHPDNVGFSNKNCYGFGVRLGHRGKQPTQGGMARSSYFRGRQVVQIFLHKPLIDARYDWLSQLTQ